MNHGVISQIKIAESPVFNFDFNPHKKRFMETQKKTVLIKRSLIAMSGAWLLASVGFALAEGGGTFSDILGLLFYTGIFVGMAWLAFIFPFLKTIYKISQIEKLKLLFPLLTGIYGSITFIILFTLIFAREWLGFEMFASSLNILAFSVGTIWGLLFILQKK